MKKYCISLDKSLKSKNPNNKDDVIDAYCEDMLLEATQKYEQLDQNCKKMEIAYQECANFYCEDPMKAPSDEIGKKLFNCVLYIFNTEKVFYELEEKRKKE